MTVGVTNSVDIDQLREVASRASDIFYVEQFDELEDAIEGVVQQASPTSLCTCTV